MVCDKAPSLVLHYGLRNYFCSDLSYSGKPPTRHTTYEVISGNNSQCSAWSC